MGQKELEKDLKNSVGIKKNLNFTKIKFIYMNLLIKISLFFLVIFAIFSFQIIDAEKNKPKKVISSAQNLALIIAKKKRTKKHEKKVLFLCPKLGR